MSDSDYSYAVEYSPSNVSSTPAVKVDDLDQLGIRYVRVQIADPTNQVRYRVLPVSAFKKILKGPRPSITILQAILAVAFLSIAEGFSPDSEYLLVPDLSTLRVLSYKPGFASVTGNLELKVPTPGLDGALSTKADFCPRTILQNVIQRAKSAGVEFLVGFEIEFILLKSTSPIVTVHNTQAYTNSLALPTGSVQEKMVEELADSLQQAGIELQLYHAEAAPGQYEFSTGPLPPLEAADALVFTQQSIFNIASKHGLRATLAPRIHNFSCGSAVHAHISVHSTTQPKSAIPPSKHPNLNALESSFLAGLLSNLRAAVALSLPLPASYDRVVDGVFSGGTWVSWGTDSREVPVRLTHATSPGSRNFEVKTMDGTANPHLALAGFLGAGLAGVKDQQELTVGDCCGLSAAQRGEEGREKVGVTTRLPLSWEEARESLKESKVLTDVLGGASIVTKFLSVNANIAKALDVPSTQEEKLSLLVDNY